jgi:hypothetical protein
MNRPEFRALPEVDSALRSSSRVLAEVVFPRSCAVDANDAMDRLFEVLPDHQARLISESPSTWTFELRWTSDPLTFVDPGISDTVAHLYGLVLSEIGGYREVMRWGGRDVVFSLIHGWALLTASLAVERRGGRPIEWVVHVDDHTDLGSLAATAGERSGSLRDSVFGTDIDLNDPASVTAAVERGTVSKGNFLTAYLLAYPESQVVHVGDGVPEQSFAIIPRGESIHLGGAPLPGSAIPLDQVPEPGAPTFRKTRILPLELPSQGCGGVWLDIDLDYFCNRYDGDSDRQGMTAAPDERTVIMERVERFLVELGAVQWLGQVEAVSLAVSPGFFPVDHWADVIGMLRDGIQRVLGD